MPPDAADRRVLKGAKSCAECRRRKIRCVWSSNETCNPCLANKRTCVPQLQRFSSRDGTRASAKERISHLERDMAALVALVKDGHAQSTPSKDQANVFSADLLNQNLENAQDTVEMTDYPRPSHLRFLFGDLVADSQRENRDKEGQQQSNPYIQSTIRLARTELQSLLPSYDEVLKISPYASSWMSLYYTLFPPAFALHTADQLIENYNQMHEAEADLPTLAMYLLSVAITIQQMPSRSLSAGFYGSQGTTRFIESVCRTVDDAIIRSKTIPMTPEFLETAMLHVRLSLGRGNLKGTWLTLRRIISLAELMGLPQSNYELGRLRTDEAAIPQNGPEEEFLTHQANIWESICATDRNFSMMLNLPPGTTRYHFPREPSIWSDGTVSSRAYNYQLSNICAAIFEIDESYMSGQSHEESYEKVLRADRQLRALKASTLTWWYEVNTNNSALPDELVRFWHNYIMLRVHLRPGMMSNSDEQYEYSRAACLKACQQAVIQFPTFRRRIPSGFFVCRVLDVQVFTAATFLLLSSRSQSEPLDVDSHTIQLVQAIVDCFASVGGTAGADLANEAQGALVSLISLVRGQENTEWSQPVLKLQIPLLGTISIDRASLSPSVETAPFSWSLELNDSSFWMVNDFATDGMWAPPEEIVSYPTADLR